MSSILRSESDPKARIVGHSIWGWDIASKSFREERPWKGVRGLQEVFIQESCCGQGIWWGEGLGS